VRVEIGAVVIDHRFRGPANSGNGGYVAGRLAAFVDGAAEVTLRLPPPLEVSMRVEHDGDGVRLLDGDALVAEAVPVEVDVEVPAPPSLDDARRAVARHVRFGSPGFAECYVCGIRPRGDGLGIHVGTVDGREPLHAAPWSVHERGPEFVWAAIDCPGAYAVGAQGRGEVVLGRMAAEVLRVPALGDECIAAAWPLGEDGRKFHAGTALFAADGELLARSRQTWILPRG
jgi:hypothetical protein